jgi:hyperosmotically inducible periplasmic protein
MSLVGDAALTFKIKAALIADERIGAGRINVDTSDGTVTLRGEVPYPAIRELAEAVAIRSGARHVVNELLVRNPSYEADSALIPEDAPHVTTPPGAPVVDEPSAEEAVMAALAADDRVNEHLIRVCVENGIAYLSGRQDNVAARDAAIEVAAHVPGILGVSNDIEVLPSV